MLKSLRIQNFRSHDDFSRNFTDGPIIITGNNGVGKTTLMEAIYIAMTGKSWRSNFREILQKNQTWWRIDLVFTDKQTRTVKFIDNHKEFIINNKSSKTLPKNSHIPTLLFEPNDLMIIYGSPSRRREFFDRFISQIDPNFSRNLAKFERILRQRNNLLKSGFATIDNLFVWDIQFAKLSYEISRQRAEIIKLLNEKILRNYQQISGINDASESNIKLKFISDNYETDAIIREIQSDFRSGILTTKIGAQRDDYEFIFAKKNAKTSASRGENRTFLFAILASFAEILNDRFREKIYILLDDVDGELDANHRKNLYEIPAFRENNLLVTTIDFKGDVKNHIKL